MSISAKTANMNIMLRLILTKNSELNPKRVNKTAESIKGLPKSSLNPFAYLIKIIHCVNNRRIIACDNETRKVDDLQHFYRFEADHFVEEHRQYEQ